MGEHLFPKILCFLDLEIFNSRKKRSQHGKYWDNQVLDVRKNWTLHEKPWLFMRVTETSKYSTKYSEKWKEEWANPQLHRKLSSGYKM